MCGVIVQHSKPHTDRSHVISLHEVRTLAVLATHVRFKGNKLSIHCTLTLPAAALTKTGAALTNSSMY